MKRPTALSALLLRLAAATFFCFVVTSSASAQYQTANSGVLVNFQSVGIYSNPGNFVNATLAARLNGNGTVTIGGCISSNAPGIANATYSMNPFQIIDGTTGQVVGTTSFFNQNLPGSQTAIPFPVTTFTPSAPVVDGSRLEIVAQLILSDSNNFPIDTRGKVNGQNVSSPNPRPPGSYNYTTFRFSANNFAGTCGLGALPPCPTTSGSSFSAAPTSINQGQSSTLSWNVPNASSVTIAGVGTFGAAGSVVVSPASTTTYTLTAAGPSADCAPVSLQATVAVTACQAIASFSASATTINAGQSTTLSYSLTNATSATITDLATSVVTNVPVQSGSLVVTPATTRTYRLTVNGACAALTQDITITVNQPPAINTFTASASTICAGASTTLSWTSTGGTSASITDLATAVVTSVPVNGSLSVSPASTRAYRLTITNGAGSVTQDVTINVTPLAAINSFSASATTINAGQSTNLSFSVSNTTSRSITDLSTGSVTGLAVESGTITFTPASTRTYRLTAANGCNTVTQDITITVTQPPTISAFNASASPICAGNPSTLSWSASGGTAATISAPGLPGSPVSVNPNSGSLVVTPSATTTYTLTVSNSAGSVTQTVTVTVTPAPSISSFTASATTVNAGQSTTLSYASADGTSASITDLTSGSVTPVAVPNGSLVVTPATSRTYRLTVSGACGTVTQDLSITVTQAPVISSFTATPSAVCAGQSATLAWASSGATSASVADLTSGTVTSVPVNGSLVVTPATTRTYRLTVTNNAGSDTRDLTITVTQLVVINNFSASATTINAGQSTTLAFNVSNSTTRLITDLASGTETNLATESGTLVVTPATTRSYRLTASNDCNTVTQDVTITVTQAPVISAFTASASPICAGQSTTLSWTATGGTAATIAAPGLPGSPVSVDPNSGTLAVTPSSTTTYTLTVTNDAGSATSTTTVTVTPAPTIPTFTATPATINQGQSSTLAWTSANGTSATITDLLAGTVINVGLNSSLVVTPATTRTYRLNISGSCGTATQDVMVTVNASVVINSFAASVSPICDGQSSTLSWSATGGTAATISASGLPGSPVSVNPNSGSLVVTPNTTTTYTLTVTGAGGQSATSQTTVTVNQPPTINTFTASPTTINAGQSTTLSWTTTNASYTVLTDLATGNNIAVFAPNDSYLATPASTRTYRLTAADAAGCALPTRDIIITVTTCQTITSFTASPTAITTGGTSTLSWATAGATSVDILDLTNTTIITTGQPANGSFSVTPASTTIYRLRANGSCAPQTQDVTVTVCPVASASTFTAAPATINAGQNSTLSWNVPNASTVSISGVAGTFGAAGSTTVSPSATTTYTLTAQGDAGCAPVTLQATVNVIACPTVAGSTFRASPSSIGPSQSSTLSWNVPNATSVTISGIAGTFAASGSVSVSPSATTTYTLSATGGAGCAAIQLQTTVTVTPCQIINALTVNGFNSDTSAAQGSTVTVAWDISNFTTASITVYTNGVNSGSFPLTTPTGNRAFTQPSGSLSFIMIVDGACQQIQLQRNVFTVACPTAAGSSFTASPSPIAAGQSSTLSWNVPDAVSVTISGVAGTFGPSGSVSVSPASTTTYTLTATGASGCAPVTLQATVIVCAVKINSFTATPTAIAAGGSSTLAWNISNTTQVLINTTNGTGSFFNLPASGTLTVNPAQTTTYQLVALSDGGACSDSALATVSVASGAVLLGPQGQPAAVGPNDTNDDYTNLTMTNGVAGPVGSVTTAGTSLTFTNTISNQQSSTSDTYTLTARVIPAGFTVALSTDGGTNYISLNASGSATLTLGPGAQANVLVRVITPASGLNVLTGFDTVIRATSGITPANFNETIDRVWSGFVSAVKTQTVTNSTGVGGPSDAVSGATINYALTYTNVTVATGTGNVNLTATNVVLLEDGNAPPNNWGATTNHVPGFASDTLGGAIVGDVAGSTLLRDTVPSLAPAQNGVFRFRRVIK